MPSFAKLKTNEEVLDDIHDDDDYDRLLLLANATSISGLNSRGRQRPQSEPAFHSAVKTKPADGLGSENAAVASSSLDALNLGDKDDDVFVYEVSEEAGPIVTASEDKNHGEVVAVTEANSLNEAVKPPKTSTSTVPGKVAYSDRVQSFF